jgi:hypothetical protein
LETYLQKSTEIHANRTKKYSDSHVAEKNILILVEEKKKNQHGNQNIFLCG